MNLHENKQLFSQAVRFTSDQVGIPAIYIEKDYWVTYALHTLAHNSTAPAGLYRVGKRINIFHNATRYNPAVARDSTSIE